MFRKHTNSFLIIVSALFLSLTYSSAAGAQTCGGNGAGSTPCNCGDTVTATRTLTSSDPVVGEACPVDGLIVDPGVNLNLNGKTIRGQGNGTGILISGDDVTIRDGLVQEFGTGISGVTSDSTIDHVRAYFNEGDGIFLQNDRNTVSSSPARHNGLNGYTILGNDNTITTTNNEYNGFHGIFVDGNGNFVLNNQASENSKASGAPPSFCPGSIGEGGDASNGITVCGDGNTLDRNRISKKNDFGIFVDGNNNILTSNFVTKSNKGGIKTVGTDNQLTDNKATENHGGVGILAEGSTSTVNLNASTNNVVHGNPCKIYNVTISPQCIKK